MKFAFMLEIGHPRGAVFAAYRDHMPELVPDLPNVRRLEEISRTLDGGTTVVVNRCWGGADIPAVARPFVSDRLLQWDETSRWDAEAWTVEWSIVAPAFNAACQSHGTNRFEVLTERSTRVMVEGRIDVDVGKVPGVPKLLARTARGPVERFIVGQVTPNLEATATAIGGFVASR